MKSLFIGWVKEHPRFWAPGQEGAMGDAWAGLVLEAQKRTRGRGVGPFGWLDSTWNRTLRKAIVGVNSLSL